MPTPGSGDPKRGPVENTEGPMDPTVTSSDLLVTPQDQAVAGLSLPTEDSAPPNPDILSHQEGAVGGAGFMPHSAEIWRADWECQVNQRRSLTEEEYGHLANTLKFGEEDRRELCQIQIINNASILTVCKQKSTMIEIAEALKNINRDDLLKDILKPTENQPEPEGPELHRDLHIRKMPFSTRNPLVQELSVNRDDGKDWRRLASEFGLSQQIPLWDQRSRCPADEVLLCWQTNNEATVGKLYDILVKLGMTKAAAML